MPNAYTTNIVKRGGYSFDGDTLIELCHIAQRFLDKEPSINIQLDGDSHGIEGVPNEVLDDLYIKTKLIDRIQIEGSNHSVDPVKRISIKLSRKRFHEPIAITISGERASCTTVRDEIESLLDGGSEWYSRFFLPRHDLVQLAWFMGAWIVPFLTIPALDQLLTGSLIDGDKVKNRIFIEWGIGAVLLFLFFFFKDKMFPKVMFNIGKSASIAESAKNLRNIVGPVVGLGIVAAVIGGLIVEWFK